jgi:hypothetical protein
MLLTPLQGASHPLCASVRVCTDCHNTTARHDQPTGRAGDRYFVCCSAVSHEEDGGSAGATAISPRDRGPGIM